MEDSYWAMLWQGCCDFLAWLFDDKTHRARKELTSNLVCLLLEVAARLLLSLLP